MSFKDLKKTSFIWWVTELFALVLTLCVCFCCVWLCVPALFTRLLITQKLAMIIGYAVISYVCGRFFADVAKRIRKLKQ